MCQFQVTHTPSIKKYCISRNELVKKLVGIGIEPYGKIPFFTEICHTDMDGWGKILHDLTFSSDLYDPKVYTCVNYSLAAFVECSKRYKMNGLIPIFGNTAQGYHAWNIFYYGDGFLLFEPNEGFPFSGSAFEIGEYDYRPDTVVI